MPGSITGIQLAEEARRLQPTLKVLLTSGHTAAAVADKQNVVEAFPILAKPYRREELAVSLRELMNGNLPEPLRG